MENWLDYAIVSTLNSGTLFTMVNVVRCGSITAEYFKKTIKAVAYQKITRQWKHIHMYNMLFLLLL